MGVNLGDLPLNPPPFQWAGTKIGGKNLRVHEWIKGRTFDHTGNWDVVLVGVPLSRSSISASGASEFPEAFRRSWKGFSTYSIDADVDLSSLNVRDVGDVKMHVTDIPKCHRNIQEVSKGLEKRFPESLASYIGGDHSITAMVVKGIKEAHPNAKIGLLQFDTHLDLRDPSEQGPTNGTPIRQLIEEGVIEGRHVYNIGPHGFFNGLSLVEYARKTGVNIIPLSRAREQTIKKTVQSSLEKLAEQVDVIYVTCDMDVLDIAQAPGVPASTPGGMHTFELFEAMAIAGSHPKVKAFDIVCLDPLRDTAQQTTVKAGTHAFLSLLTGYMLRENVAN